MKFFGANWRTTASMIGGTLMAALTWLSTLSYDQGQLALLIPVEWKPWFSKIAAISTFILFAYNGIRQKDKAVTGGTIQQTVNGNVAAPGTQSLVDETVKASVASDETIEPGQWKGAR